MTFQKLKDKGNSFLSCLCLLMCMIISLISVLLQLLPLFWDLLLFPNQRVPFSVIILFSPLQRH